MNFSSSTNGGVWKMLNHLFSPVWISELEIQHRYPVPLRES